MSARNIPMLDGDTDPVERVAKSGSPASCAPMGGDPAFGNRNTDWPPQFSRRVDDAIEELRRGDSEEEVHARHGGIVLRQAKRENGQPKRA